MYEYLQSDWLAQKQETRMLTQHNQENAQWSRDPFPRERVGSGDETTSQRGIPPLQAPFREKGGASDQELKLFTDVLSDLGVWFRVNPRILWWLPFLWLIAKVLTLGRANWLCFPRLVVTYWLSFGRLVHVTRCRYYWEPPSLSTFCCTYQQCILVEKVHQLITIPNYWWYG